MGFHDVYDYAVGKADWIAMGLPTERRDTRYQEVTFEQTTQYCSKTEVNSYQP
jgi:hypothetical protein